MTMDITSALQAASRFDREKIDTILASLGLGGAFNIEDFWQAIDLIENALGIHYVRMDFGVPGLLPPDICLNEHVTALETGTIAQAYPPYAGAADLRMEMAEFVTRRTGVNLSLDNFFVTCGGTQALFVAQAVAGSLYHNRKTIVFLAPVYPPMLAQARLLGLNPVCIDMTSLRGEALLRTVRAAFANLPTAAICWASPSNPTWTVLSHQELHGLAALCEAFDVLPIEDMTYLGMVGNCDAMAKLTPSIGLYAQKYFMVFSSSKMLSYAGERIGFLAGSDALLKQHEQPLASTFGTDLVARACASMIFNTTAGAPHSSQRAVAGVLRAINSGQFDLERHLSTYMRRAATLKEILRESGFTLITGSDESQVLDGFYVCFSYENLSGAELATRLLYCGVSVLPLSAFSSQNNNGVRACVGRLDDEKLAWVRERLGNFSGR